jgi:endogenous inhibitor of DNA gyrase (YacG/DUF329 family)
MAANLKDLAEHRQVRRRESEPLTPSATAPDKGSHRCPICGAPAANRYRPFCSARCADVDLARWLNERYSVPGDPVTGSGESEKSEPD